MSCHIGSRRAQRDGLLALALLFGAGVAVRPSEAKDAAPPQGRAWPEDAAAQQDTTPTAVPEAPDALPGWIAYTRRADEDFVWEIFRAKADGTQDGGLTHHALAGKGADAPRWSPDGRWLLYATTDKSGQVVTMWRLAHDGGTPSPIATVRAPQAGAGSVGPDSAAIVFVAAAAAGPSTTDLLIREADGQVRPLVASAGREEDMPDWSPATRRLVFSARTIEGPAASHGWDLFTVDADGSSEALVSGQDGVSECSPRWSPDGSRVVYLAVPGQTCFGAGTLHVLDVGSGDDRPVLGGASIQASWSPDGSWLLVYNTYNGGLYPPGQATPAPQARLQLKGLYVLRLDDGALFRLKGPAGGSSAKEGSYLWGQVADWNGGTVTPSPEASLTPSATATDQPSPTVPTPSASPSATASASATSSPSPTATSLHGASPSPSVPPTSTTQVGTDIFLPLALRNAPPGGANRR